MRAPAVTPAVALAVALVVVAAACSRTTRYRAEPAPTTRGPDAAPGRSTTTPGSRSTGTAPLAWSACGTGTECATLTVPLDRSGRDPGSIGLALFRHRADGRPIGSLLVNPGGPGASGRFLATDADRVFPAAVRARFDIVAWDPRGTGASSPVDCGPDLDAFFAVDRDPRTAAAVRANVAAARAFAAACARRSGRLLAHVATRDTVADMDAIRAALGESQLSYLGFSYGTYLGTRYALRYPARVRAMVLDGAVDPQVGVAAGSIQQSDGFERDLQMFLADCAGRPACAFYAGGNPQSALRRLLDAIAAEPLFAGPDRTLGPTEARLGIVTALYGGRSAWPPLAEALAAAARGDGSQLLGFSDQYVERKPDGTYGSGQAAFFAISCLDGQLPSTLAQVQAIARASARTAPILGPFNAWLGLPCAYWPVRPVDGPAPVRAPRGLPTVVVIAGRNDPATPYAWGAALARELGARLISVDTEEHTAYTDGGACVQDPVDAYLVSGTPPASDRSCGRP